MSPRTVSQLEVIREESRERILGAALTLFGQYGYEGTSVRMIGAAAGVSPTLLYAYFEGKDGLLEALITRRLKAIQASFVGARVRATAREQLAKLVRTSVEIVMGEAPFWRLVYGLRFQDSASPALRHSLIAWSTAIRDPLTTLMRLMAIPRPEAEAKMLSAAIDGVAQQALLDDSFPVELVVDALLAKYR